MDQNLYSKAVRDHSREQEGFKFVYAVISRRAGGLSIGINLNLDKKCTFNCVYCEVDRRKAGLQLKPTPELVEQELRQIVELVLSGQLSHQSRFKGLDAIVNSIRDFAFSGDGEPTMLSKFYEFVEAAAKVRSEFKLNTTKLVLITNATLLHKPSVLKGIELLAAHNGQIWAKLDGGTNEYIREINRTNVAIEQIVQNITKASQICPLIIQSLFLRWKGQLISDKELQAYCERLNEIKEKGGKIELVHAYTIARVPAEPEAEPLSLIELDRIAVFIREKTALPVKTFP